MLCSCNLRYSLKLLNCDLKNVIVSLSLSVISLVEILEHFCIYSKSVIFGLFIHCMYLLYASLDFRILPRYFENVDITALSRLFRVRVILNFQNLSLAIQSEGDSKIDFMQILPHLIISRSLAIKC